MTPPLLYFMLLAAGADDLPVAPKDAAKAVITEINGKAPSETEDLGEQLRLTARNSVFAEGKPKAVKWIVYPKARSDRKYTSSDGLDLIIPVGLKPVDIQVILSVACGDTTDVTDVTVECGKGPRPPPNDDDVKPIPDDGVKPTPKPPVASVLKFIVVEDAFNRNTETAGILNETFWDGLPKRGHVFVLYPENTMGSKGLGYVDQIKKKFKISAFNVGDAYLIVEDVPTGKTLSLTKLPPVAEIESMISLFTGK